MLQEESNERGGEEAGRLLERGGELETVEPHAIEHRSGIELALLERVHMHTVAARSEALGVAAHPSVRAVPGAGEDRDRESHTRPITDGARGGQPSRPYNVRIVGRQ